MNAFKSSAASSPVPPEFSVLSIARMLWKQKFLIFLLWVAVSLVAMYQISKLPPVYRAEAIILVDRQKIPERLVESTVNPNVQNRLSYISEQILSSRRLTAVLTDFDLFPGEQWQRTPEDYAERIRRDITVGQDRPGPRARQGVIRIGFRGSNRNVVASVANRLANLFIEENLKTRELMAEGTTEFLDSQLQEAKKNLDGQEAALTRYKIQFNGELPQQEQQLGATLGRIQANLEASRDAVNRANQSIITLENNITLLDAEEKLQGQAFDLRANAVEEASRRPATSQVRARQTPAVPEKESETLARQLRSLRTKYGEGHPDIRRLQAVLDHALQLEAQQANGASASAPADTQAEPDTPSASSGSSIALANTEITRLNVEAVKLRRQDRISGMRTQIEQNKHEIEQRTREQEQITKNIGVYQEKLGRLPIREQQMAQVTRDHANASAQYQSLLGKKAGAEMASELEHRQKAERFTLIEPARVPDAPVSPNRTLLNSISTAVGFVFGAIVGLLLELRKGKLLGEWELPPSVVVLAHLPRIQISSGQSVRARIFRGKWKVGTATAAALTIAAWIGRT